MATKITNLPVDVVSRIISSVAKSRDGARDVAISMSTCRLFLEASNSIVVHKAVCFQNVQLSGRTNLFQRTNGLLCKCVKAGNVVAEYLLAQVMLTTSTQLLDFNMNMTKAKLNRFRDYCPKYNLRHAKAREYAVAASFLVHFTPVPGPTNAQGSNPESPSTLHMSFHWELVKVFICKSTMSDFWHMYYHLFGYVELFGGGYLSPPRNVFNFRHLIQKMFSICCFNDETMLIPVESSIFDRYESEGFVPPPNREAFYVRQVGNLFEDMRAKALDIFDVIIPTLR